MKYRLQADSVAARFALGMIPSCGIIYANATPLIVSALEQSAEFTAETAGFVFSANMFGTSLGGLLVITVVRVLPWRLSCILLATCIACLDFASVWIEHPTMLAAVRFAHGLTGGAIMGFGSMVIARAGNADRPFGIMIAIQMVIGGIMAAWLAPLISVYGVYPIWVCLIVFSLVCLSVLPFLSDYQAPRATTKTLAKTSTYRAPLATVVLAGLALFAYQAGEMAAYTYIFEHGQTFGLSDSFMGWTSAASLWIGVFAALGAAYWSTRYGYVLPALVGGLLTAGAIFLLIYPSAVAYLVASIAFGICFCATIPYLLSLITEMDNTGQLASIGAFVSSLGLASGPFFAAVLLGLGADYVGILTFAAIAIICSSLLAVSPGRYLEKAEHNE